MIKTPTTIYFDMDGTIADFYSVPNWLDYLEAQDTTPYAEAKPLFNFSAFARSLHRLQAEGYRIGIISALSKSGNDTFHKAIKEVKSEWLSKHLPSVKWDEIHYVPYGSNKTLVANRTTRNFLFDDEAKNRQDWGTLAYNVENLLKTLREIAE